ncbi:hypothetical protein L1987_62229 [Smallanthus sonchifolius]|uniref:Uncharacterized protein n=1 Tax=Smallanthus sonchifolius TaxID=185202 RepID=A0ACB9C9V3_9ASTR|nr:hypothetical protein L1987_62229 [Smallanthus sonchifolius]
MLIPYINIFFLLLRTTRSIDTISMHQNISDGETIVSGNAEFELGFFSPGSSKYRYMGIWLKNTSLQTVLWVANRETPLLDTLGSVKLDNQGNLTLVGGSGKVIWSSNTSASGTNINLVAQLLDTGNLVITNSNITNIDIFIWQSFDYPGDTYLPGMKVGKNFITGRETYMTSWRSADDPSHMYITCTYDINTTTLRAIVTPSGKFEIWHLKFSNPEWMPVATIPEDFCDNYGVCDPYGSCTSATSPNCECLKGFERKNSDNDTSVCQRRIAFDCGPREGFLKFSSMKLPDTENAVFSSNMSLSDCEVACKNNCSCTAYANPNITSGGVGCLQWYGGLIDVRVFPQNGQDLYVRLAALALSAVLTLSGLILAFYIRRKWKKTSNAENS